MVDPEVRSEIPNSQVGPAEFATKQVQSTHSDGDTKVAEQDELLVLALVQRTGRVEVVDTVEQAVLLALALAFDLLLVVVVASNIGNQISRPTS